MVAKTVQLVMDAVLNTTVGKKGKKKIIKNTLKAAYEDATARRYGSIHELIVILLARAMYG